MSDLSKRIAALSPEQRAAFERRLQQKGLSLHRLQAIPRRSQAGDAPLSFAQERLWFLHQLAPDSPVYNGPSASSLSGPLRLEALQRSLNELVRRHETLRTSFALLDGQPLQRIAPAQPMPLPLIELSALPEAAREGVAEQLLGAEVRRPFELESGPLARAMLLRLGCAEHILLFTMHHIICDGWSTELLVHELAALYEAFASARPSPLAPLPIQYADYAAWLREWLQDEGDHAPSPLQTQLDYWRQTLADAPPLLSLPTDRPRPAVERFEGALQTFALPDALHAALSALSQREGASLFMTLLAAFQVLLARNSGQEDIVVGSPVANRSRAELSSLIGFFANNLVLRTDLSGKPSFRELLGRVRAVATSAYAHQELPFELLVKELNPERSLSHAPLFQVAFNLQRVLVPELERAGVRLRPLLLDNGTAKLDLNLFIWEEDQRLSGSVEYSSDLFEAATIRRLSEHLRNLLLGIVADPDQRIGELPLLSEAERRQLLFEWNATEVAYPAQARLQLLVAAQVERSPDAVAVVFDGTTDHRPPTSDHRPPTNNQRSSFSVQSLSYRELNARANQLAHYLRTLGVGPEVVVGVRLERSLELPLALLAVLKAGGAYLPLDPSYPAERITFMLEDSCARVVLTMDNGSETRRAGDKEMDDLLVSPSPPLLVSPRVVDLHRDWPRIAQERGDAPADATLAEQLAYVIYTSGSTGQPKGALNTHRGIVNRLLWMQQRYGLTADDRVLQKTPFSFDVSVWEFFWPLLSGARLVVAQPGGHKDPAYLLRLIEEQRISTLHFVPSMLQVFVEQPGLERCGCLRRVICSGEALPYQLQQRFFARLSAELHNLYGPTEAAVDVSAWACVSAGERPDVPIGRPIANTELYVLDGQFSPQPVGVAGELYIGGVQLARGYLGRPELTAERFVPNPFADFGLRAPSGHLDFGLAVSADPIQNPKSKIQNGERLYKTGDLARYRADGALEFLGRLDHQVKLRGFRIELDEIAVVLARHMAVREAVVLAREDAPGDMRLVAYVVPATDHRPPTTDQRLQDKEKGRGGEGEDSNLLVSLSPALISQAPSFISSLRDYLKQTLPDYMLPSSFVLLSALPLTLNGKLDRKALPAPDSAFEELAESFDAPRGPVEELLAELWMQLLGVARVGHNDNFFALGGHSLLAAQLITRVREALQADLSLRSLFEAPTIAGLAERVVEARSVDGLPPGPPLLPQPRGERLPLSFAQQRLWFLDQLEPGNAAYIIPSAVQLHGALDIAVLARSINAIVQRHEALRTTFATVAGQPVQVIAPTLAIALPLLDLCGLPADARESASRDLIAGAAAQPFDLAHGPLMRAALLRLDEQAHILLMTMHHSVSDGWSLGVFVRELATLYTAGFAGGWDEANSLLPPLPIQYADYAIWQRARLQGERVEVPLAYWRAQLAGVPPLALPTDHSHPLTPRFRGALRWFALPPDLSEALAALSRNEGVTLFMTLLAAFQALLARYSGQTDITVGSPIAGRTQIETEPLIGFFVNTLVLRANLAGDPSVRELLRQMREVTLDAYTHQELPFEMLVEDLQPARGTSRTPLFQVMLILQNAPMPVMELSGLTLQLVEAESGATKFDLTQLTGLALQLVEAESGAAKFDLTLSMQESDHGLIGMLEYSTDLFEPTTITRILAHFQRLLESMAADPAQRLASLPLLANVERQQLLVEWNDTGSGVRGQGSGVSSDPSDIWCIHELFEAQAARTPDAVAVVFDGTTNDQRPTTNDQRPTTTPSLQPPASSLQQLTYAELNRRANQLAQHLRGLGVGPEVLVGLCVERSIAAMIGLLGVLKAGGTYLPLDPAYPAERLAFMLDDSRARVLLTATIDHRPPTTDSPDKETRRQGDHRISDLLVSQRVVDLHADWPAIAQAPDEAPPSTATPDSAAYVIYTSGSTGQPKGVVGLQRGVLNRAAWMWATYPFAPGERCCQKTALGFVDSIWEIFGPLLRGVPLVVVPDATVRDTQLLIGVLARQQITRIVLVPALLRALMEGCADPAWQLPQLACWISSGEALPLELAQQFHARLPGRTLLNLYGSSEVAADVLWHAVRPDAALANVPIGRPLANTAIYLLDAAARPVPVGVAGELYVGGAGLARGYLGRPELTAERFIPNPFGTVGSTQSAVCSQLPTADCRLPTDTASHVVTLSPCQLVTEGGDRLYRTGDLARYRPDGMIEYLGRADDQVKIRGFRIELTEIEAALRQHPAVREAAALAREDAPGDKRLVAYIVPSAEHEQEDKETRRQGDEAASDLLVSLSPGLISQAPSIVGNLRTDLKQKLPEHMIPAAFVLLDALPLTPSGKLDRQALPVPDYQAALASTFVAPRTQTEAALAEIWAELLGLEEMGIYDNFFDLGGHSLLATQVLTRIREVFDVQLPLAVVFTNFTIAELGKQVAQRQITAAPQEDVAALLEHLGTLSDEEVQRLLASMS